MAIYEIMEREDQSIVGGPPWVRPGKRGWKDDRNRRHGFGWSSCGPPPGPQRNEENAGSLAVLQRDNDAGVGSRSGAVDDKAYLIDLLFL